ncbi:helix-turn-helix transcriptional regulator [Actinoplanes aureus]|uniref:Helix-turn-helix transcriptional regulator n=1 Tax=Actinoplanes aureus TaxID=2792083 RepID=A0A931CH48_9ACTN|nr:helix-turn-helix transcriptional regulator [Actinoplanes aureus]MBG0566043.1 helix-turn-helix transcriptional regulator [Actinoplanes aureus]
MNTDATKGTAMVTSTVPNTTAFVSTDADTISGYLSDAYGAGMRVSSSDHNPQLRHRRTHAPGFHLETIAQSATLDFDGEPLPTLVIVTTNTARLQRTSGDSDRRYRPGDVCLGAYPGRPFTCTWSPGELTTCVLDLAVLDRIAAPAPAWQPTPVRFTSLDPHSATAAAHWRHTHAYVTDLLDNPEAAGSPLLIANATHLLATAALATFANTALTDPTIEDRRDATPTTLRRALAYIDDNADQTITVADIAAAARVSIRALQLAFRRYRDTTPMAHLHRVRLQHADHMLATADPSTTTVAAVAARWGFTNPRLFAAHYRNAYGVPPSHTLHKHS